MPCVSWCPGLVDVDLWLPRQLRHSDALLQTAKHERDELAAKVAATEVEKPVVPDAALQTPSVARSSPPAVPTPPTLSEPPQGSVYTYLIAELGIAEKRSRDLEYNIQELERTLQAEDASLSSANKRCMEAEDLAIEFEAELQLERGTAARKLRQAVAKAEEEAETKRKRDVMEASEPVQRLRSAPEELCAVSFSGHPACLRSRG